MYRTKLLSVALISAASMLSSPTFADTKSGLDAWERGDYAAALQEWRTGAAKNDVDAVYFLGQALMAGQGVKQDLAEAEKLFERAAAAGHLRAADNYGLLLFQRGERIKALPYVRTASEHGDPRAQYLLGIAHYNGELMPKDRVRGYALVSLARQQGLPQAGKALEQMDQNMPMDQRQQAVALASELDNQMQTNLARKLAAAELGVKVPDAQSGTTSPQIDPSMRTSPAAAVAASASAIAKAGSGTPAAPILTQAKQPNPPAIAAVSKPTKPAALPVPLPPLATNKPVGDKAAAIKPATPKPPVAAAPLPAVSPAPAIDPMLTSAPINGPWRIQFGAFGVAANADALWNKVKGRSEVAGHPRMNVKAGSAIKLQASGYATRAAAQGACAKLTTAGITCIVTSR